MVFELMTNGTAVRLPGNAVPDNMELPNGPFVLLLLPQGRCLIGTHSCGAGEKWEWGRPGSEMHGVFLYDGEPLTLAPAAGMPVVLPAGTVAMLKRELVSLTPPPGDHLAAAMMLRSFMRDREAFSEGELFRDEAFFAECLKSDGVLNKCYWAMRFALERGEFDEAARLKAWLKAGPELFTPENGRMRLWFSILDMPDDEALGELEKLSFSNEDIKHMAAQKVIPLILFNPSSGYLILSHFGSRRGDGTAEPGGFFLWGYIPPEKWNILRERRKLSIQEIMTALWAQYDIDRALEERARYS